MGTIYCYVWSSDELLIKRITNNILLDKQAKCKESDILLPYRDSFVCVFSSDQTLESIFMKCSTVLKFVYAKYFRSPRVYIYGHFQVIKNCNRFNCLLIKCVSKRLNILKTNSINIKVVQIYVNPYIKHAFVTITYNQIF